MERESRVCVIWVVCVSPESRSHMDPSTSPIDGAVPLISLGA
jgi:hypothetical protein